MNLSLLFTNFIAEEKNLDVDNNQILKHCFQLREQSDGLKTSNYGGWHSEYLDPLDDVLNPLIDIVLSNCNEIKKEFGFKQEKIVDLANYWVNINHKNNFNLPHLHIDSFLSVVYYVKVPKKSGKIMFKNPILAHQYTIHNNMIDEFTHFNSSEWGVQPEEGQLLIFPSWLEHYVQPNESNDYRVSIAFNTKLI